LDLYRADFNTREDMKFPYNWTLANAKFTKDKGKVFSCFACGGGSTMGYKLAGFDVIGANDIDKKMAEVYKLNHDPKYYFLESITTLAKRKDLPKELYNLDILDGSPPCSSFSMAGNREKDWGKEKVFREGQELQVLDTLFFDFIDLAKELQPKVVVAENVKGLLLGAAKEYVIKIYEAFDKAGYYVQHWLLDASKMGVPQRRERVFFIALRKDLAAPFMFQKDIFTEVPKLELEFNEKEILFKEFDSGKPGYKIPPCIMKDDAYIKCNEGESMGNYMRRTIGKEKFFSYKKVDPNRSLSTILAAYDSGEFRHDLPNFLHAEDLINGGSYPQDYNFLKLKHKYLIGMSVPPVMTAQIATEIYNQWLKKL
jgi:DNA (cytosine-5)-methyltransferase 1